jgi:NADH-quinone oxidoreductase subunit M
MALVLGGIAIREAVVPVHSWFPRFVERAPMAVVVAFFVPQLGVYAQFELLSGALPEGAGVYVAVLGALTALASAALGSVQDEPRRALAYLMMSQTGLVALGLESESVSGRVGAALSWQVLALALSGFAMSLGALEARVGKLSLREPKGNFARTPRLGAVLLVLGLASVGLPLTLGFVSEDLISRAAIEQSPMLSVSQVLATALNGVTVMRMFSALFTGSRVHIGQQDLTRRETFALTLVLGVLLSLGLWPEPVLRLAVG